MRWVRLFPLPASRGVSRTVTVWTMSPLQTSIAAWTGLLMRRSCHGLAPEAGLLHAPHAGEMAGVCEQQVGLKPAPARPTTNLGSPLSPLKKRHLMRESQVQLQCSPWERSAHWRRCWKMPGKCLQSWNLAHQLMAVWVPAHSLHSFLAMLQSLVIDQPVAMLASILRSWCASAIQPAD